MEYEVIARKDAPENLSNFSDDSRKRLMLLRNLKPEEVIKVPLPNTVTDRRPVKVAFSRLAGKQNPKIALEMWEDETYLYIGLAQPKEEQAKK